MAHPRLSRALRTVAMAALGAVLLDGALMGLYVGGVFGAGALLCPHQAAVGPIELHSDEPLTGRDLDGMTRAVRLAREAGVPIEPRQPVYLVHTALHAVWLTGSIDTTLLGGYRIAFDWVVLNASRPWGWGPIDPRVAAHELTHAAVTHTIGRVRSSQLPWWKSEGLASFVEWQGEERAHPEGRPVLHDFGRPAGDPDSYFWARGLVTMTGALGGDPTHPLSGPEIEGVADEPEGTVPLADRLRPRVSDTDWAAVLHGAEQRGP